MRGSREDHRRQSVVGGLEGSVGRQSGAHVETTIKTANNDAYVDDVFTALVNINNVAVQRRQTRMRRRQASTISTFRRAADIRQRSPPARTRQMKNLLQL